MNYCFKMMSLAILIIKYDLKYFNYGFHKIYKNGNCTSVKANYCTYYLQYCTINNSLNASKF